MRYRELRHNPAQREAMRYTLLSHRARAEDLLSENNFARPAAMFDSRVIGGLPLDERGCCIYAAGTDGTSRFR